ncbi:MAG: hypothetical protein KME43_10635 [Myxacorys chilensis ATA2-1-KO14]|nr:hypothetical protein [Myxacorys chilensis ATA2-1-KO14]
MAVVRGIGQAESTQEAIDKAVLGSGRCVAQLTRQCKELRGDRIRVQVHL